MDKSGGTEERCGNRRRGLSCGDGKGGSGRAVSHSQKGHAGTVYGDIFHPSVCRGEKEKEPAYRRGCRKIPGQPEHCKELSLDISGVPGPCSPGPERKERRAGTDAG